MPLCMQLTLKHHGTKIRVHNFKVKVAQSFPTLPPHGLYSPWDSSGQNTGVASLSLLMGIFPIQGSKPGLLHCRWIRYQLSHKGSPRILGWVAYPFSSRSMSKGEVYKALNTCLTFRDLLRKVIIKIFYISVLLGLERPQ